jgi:hypothetical protein
MSYAYSRSGMACRTAPGGACDLVLRKGGDMVRLVVISDAHGRHDRIEGLTAGKMLNR